MLFLKLLKVLIIKQVAVFEIHILKAQLIDFWVDTFHDDIISVDLFATQINIRAVLVLAFGVKSLFIIGIIRPF